MGQVYESITPALQKFIAQQPLYFIGTAAAQGHINVSPKAPISTFTVLGPTRVAYLDRVGSGIETAAHVQADGRICFMFCSFSARPNIVRLQGTARVVWPDDAEFANLASHFDEGLFATPGHRRSIVVADLDRISDSCGDGVPIMTFERDRDTCDRWAAGLQRKSPTGLADYMAAKNTTSIDGLPGVPA